jgi:hypothetical protein
MNMSAPLWSTLAALLGIGAASCVYLWARARAPSAIPTVANRWSLRSAALATYLAMSAVGHLGWELAQLPLFGIWTSGTMGELAFATVHCTGGDLLIATSVLLAALVLASGKHWPCGRFVRVAIVAIGLGVAYTAYSEWQNVYVSGAWSYASTMPTLNIAGHVLGLAPLAQWIVVPTLALLAVRPMPSHAVAQPVA